MLSAPRDAADGAAASAAAQLLVCAGGETVGLPMERVQEVLPARPATPLPGAPEAVHGLVSVRGRPVTVVDLGAALGGALAADAPHPRLLVIRWGPRLLGLLVDEALRVHVAAPPPEAADGEPGDAPAGEPYRQLDLDALLAPLFA